MREVDVPLTAGARKRFAADEEEALLAHGRWTEVVGCGVDGLAEVRPAHPTGSPVARASRAPDVESALAAGAIGRDVQAQAVRRLDRAAVERRRVDLRAVTGHLVEFLCARPANADPVRVRTRTTTIAPPSTRSCEHLVPLSIDCRPRVDPRHAESSEPARPCSQPARTPLETSSIRVRRCFATRVTNGVMSFHVLGPLEAQLGEESLALGGAKQRAVLAVLLLRAGEVVSVERLVDEVWGEEPPPSAAHTLESYVSRLRQLFTGHGPRLVRRGAGYASSSRPPRWMPAAFFELQERASLAAAMEEHAEVVELTAAALAMWRGPALADVALASAGRAEADRLEELRLRTYELRFDAELTLGRHEHAIGELQKLFAQNPYRERFVAQLMLALYRCGRHAEALDTYEGMRRRLDGDLGLQPSTDLQQLSGQIVRQDPQLRRTATTTAQVVPSLLQRRRTRRMAELVLVGQSSQPSWP